MKTAEDVLKFWFVEHGQEDWFGAKPEFDDVIAMRTDESDKLHFLKAEAKSRVNMPDAVLAEIGIDPARVAALRERDVVA